MTTRPSDPNKFYFRSNRFAKINDNWFFSTREGCLEGPFATRKHAISAAERYTALQATRFFNTKAINNINSLQIT